LRMAGATAFFTTFALPPIIIILVQLFSLFLNKKVAGAEIMKMLSSTLGNASAVQIRQTTRGFGTLAQTWYIAIAGFVFLLFVATTLFTVIKNTLNDIWNIKVKERPGLLFNLLFRARSLGVIVAAGCLFVVSVYIGFKLMGSGHKVSTEWGVFLKASLNGLIVVFIITTWFIILFRYLGDGRPVWKATIAGGFLTGLLFSAGKLLLSFVLKSSNIVSIYGPSASIVLILLFVFYSSFILYFGASFIKVYSEAMGKPIIPLNEKAYRYRLQKIE
jgi:membrane protein